MTFVLGWCDDEGAFICADSAVTRDRETLGDTSSFGEAQRVDGRFVEEGAVKLLELPRSVLVGVSGEAGAALDFIASVRDRLTYTETPLRQLLAEVSAIADRRFLFTLLFAHRIDGIPVLTAFDIETSSIEDVGRERFVSCGSMPGEKTQRAARLVDEVRLRGFQHGLPPSVRLAAALSVLQSMGITDYLPRHGVGGAFFGAYVSRDHVVWQPDLDYLTYSPNTFAESSRAQSGGQNIAAPSTDVGKIRVLVRHGAGILLSSLGSPPARVLIPPTSALSEAEWTDIVLKEVPPPFPLIVPSCHFALLSVIYSKVVYIYNPDLRDGAFAITDRSGLVAIEAAPRLVETIARPVPRGRFELTIVTVDESGTTANTSRFDLPS